MCQGTEGMHYGVYIYIHLKTVIDICGKYNITKINYHLINSLVVECWHRVREFPGSITSQGPCHTKDVIKMVPVVPLF